MVTRLGLTTFLEAPLPQHARLAPLKGLHVLTRIKLWGFRFIGRPEHFHFASKVGTANLQPPVGEEIKRAGAEAEGVLKAAPFRTQKSN